MNRASETYGTTINDPLFMSSRKKGKQIEAEKVPEKIWLKISQIWQKT